MKFDVVVETLNGSFIAFNEAVPNDEEAAKLEEDVLLAREGFESEEIADFAGLNQRSPLYAGVMAICLFSLAGILLVRVKSDEADVQQALNLGNWASIVLTGIVSFFVIRGVPFLGIDGLLPYTTMRIGGVEFTSMGVFVAVAIGLVVGALMSLITEYYTAMGRRPVLSIVRQSSTGHATNVIGGLAGNPARQPTQYASILRASISRDGTLGEWRKVGEMPHSYATHSAFAHEGALWVVGGVEDNARFSELVWRAPLGRDGTPGTWSQVAQPLPFGRGHVHVTPLLGGRVYSIGGRLAPAQGSPPVTAAVVVGSLGGSSHPAPATACAP